MNKRFVTAVAAALLASSASATTSFTFDYQASGLLESATGSGGFTLAGNNGTYTLASGLDDFALSGDYSAVFLVHGTYALTKSNLASFSATLSGGALTSLSFVTKNFQAPISVFGFPAGTRRLKFTLDGLQGNNLTVNAGSRLATTLRGTLEVAAPVAAVPEPATWATMLGGMGLIGAGLRRRRARTQVTFA